MPDISDPNYTPTVEEALADLPGFVAGMTETRTIHHAAPTPDTLLADTLKLARIKGFAGIAIIDQGHHTTPYVDAVLTKRGGIGDPRNFDPQPTATAALEDLFARLGK